MIKWRLLSLEGRNPSGQVRRSQEKIQARVRLLRRSSEVRWGVGLGVENGANLWGLEPWTKRQRCWGDNYRWWSKQKLCISPIRPVKRPEAAWRWEKKDKQANAQRKRIYNSFVNDKASNLFCGGFISFNPSLTGVFHSFQEQLLCH